MKPVLVCAVLSVSRMFGQSIAESTNDKTLPDSPSIIRLLADDTSATPFIIQTLRPTVPTLVIHSPIAAAPDKSSRSPSPASPPQHDSCSGLGRWCLVTGPWVPGRRRRL